jgi:transcriptional regulator with XRE-family HTH domain
MVLLTNFGKGLQRVRKRRGLTQEDFSEVSSRTYLSSLERGLKAPTISKLEQLAVVLKLHPLSLMALGYSPTSREDVEKLCERVRADFESLY